MIINSFFFYVCRANLAFDLGYMFELEDSAGKENVYKNVSQLAMLYQKIFLCVSLHLVVTVNLISHCYFFSTFLYQYSRDFEVLKLCKLFYLQS